MNPFITKDRTSYRRWINILPGFLLPGSAQFLSGRRRAGIIWYCSSLIIGICLFCLLISPQSTYAFDQFHWFDVINWIFWIGLMSDGCRKPIPRIGFKGWAATGMFCLLLVIVPALLFRQFLAQPYSIASKTMYPTLMGSTQDAQGDRIAEDRILVNKVAYRMSSPHRGDIVVFSTSGIDSPNVRNNDKFVQRVIGLPGETISISPPNVIVNGEKLSEPDPIARISAGDDGYHGYVLAHPIPGTFLTTENQTINLAEDEYLVLGDNSPNSLDGRYFGPIKRKNIVGKFVRIIYPSARKRWID
jgi:signal peptidase I